MSLHGAGDANVFSFINAAIGWRDDGLVAQALQLLEENLPSRPDADAHLAYAHALIMAGRMREGWHQLSSGGSAIHSGRRAPRSRGRYGTDKTSAARCSRWLSSRVLGIRSSSSAMRRR